MRNEGLLFLFSSVRLEKCIYSNMAETMLLIMVYVRNDRGQVLTSAFKPERVNLREGQLLEAEDVPREQASRDEVKRNPG